MVAAEKKKNKTNDTKNENKKQISHNRINAHNSWTYSNNDKAPNRWCQATVECNNELSKICLKNKDKHNMT